MTRAIVIASLALASVATAEPHARHHHHRVHRARPIPVETTTVAEPTVAVEPAAETTPPAAIAQAAPAIAPEPAATPATTIVARHEVERPRADVLDVSAGAGVVSRQLSFNDDLFSRLHGYRLLAPAVDAALVWYPGARWTRGPAAHLGIAAHGSFVTVTQSRASDGSAYPTSAYTVGADLVGRIPIGRLQPELAAGWGRQAFEIRDGAHAKPSIPSVTQDFVRFGLGLRARLGRVELAAHGAYRLVVRAGELTSAAWFPRAHVDAVDVDAGVAVQLGRGVSVRGTFTMARLFATLNPRPGDPVVAGGAVDQSLGGSLDLAYRF